jgi:hypothetical protein
VYLTIRANQTRNKMMEVRHQWLIPRILATQEAEIRRITVQSQLRTNSSVRPYLKKPFTKIGLVEWLKVKALSSSSSLSTTHTGLAEWLKW